MSNKLFNSPFEISLHIMLLLDECKKPVSIDRIVTYDFMTVYSKTFNLSDVSLNGENGFAFSEFASRRDLVQQALKGLVIDRLITVTQSMYGMEYSISSSGKAASEAMQSEYAVAYRSLCKLTRKKYARYNDVELMNFINTAAIKSLRR